MNGKRRIVTAAVVGFVGVILLAGVGSAADKAGPITLTVGITQAIHTLNPANG